MSGAVPGEQVNHYGGLAGWCSPILLVVAAAFAVVSLSARARAEETLAPRITDLQVGFDGKFKVGYWTPFRVTLSGTSQANLGRVDLVLPDGDGVPCRVPSAQNLSLAAEGTQIVECYAKVGQLAGDVAVRLRSPDSDSVLASRLFRAGDAELSGVLPSHQTLVVALGGAFTAADDVAFESRKTKLASVDDAAALPLQRWGYEGVDAVIWDAGQGGPTASLASDPQRTAALLEWVRMGGTLVVCMGAGSSELFAPEGPLAAFVPGKLAGTVPLGPVPMLENYAEASESLVAAAGAQVPRLRNVRGTIEAYAGANPRDLPLVVRQSEGFGQIVFLAFNLGETPLAGWNARPRLVDKLLRLPQAVRSDSDTGTLGQVTTLGFVDIAGQLRGALDQFPDVPLISFWLVAVLILAYIACIGPLDYFVLKRVFGRMELTWLTFGATVVLFSAGALMLAHQLKGREVRVNQLDIVDFDLESGTQRGTSWATVFSPGNTSYDLAMAPRAPDTSTSQSRTLFAWMGLPGTGFGGMDSRAAGLPAAGEPYGFSPQLNALSGVPIAIWSSKAFVGRWWGQSEAPVAADLHSAAMLTGTLTSRLDHPLEECLLFYDRWAYRIRRFQPGQTISVESQLDPQTIDTYLRHVTVLGDRGVAPPYDRESFDVDRIVEIASWHDLVGGEKYTGLTHQYEAFLDLSSLVRNGRAVLVGRLPGDVPDVVTFKDSAGRLDEAPRQRWSYIRCVFPVRNNQGSSE